MVVFSGYFRGKFLAHVCEHAVFGVDFSYLELDLLEVEDNKGWKRKIGAVKIISNEALSSSLLQSTLRVY